MKALTNFSRWFVGILFIISGGIKANDALGFSYKLEEYFDVFDQILSLWGWNGLASLMDVFAGIALPLAMFIVVFEIVLGVAIIIGYKVKAVSWNMLLMILFFTWLTGYTATCDPYNADNISCVSDCGCFGDAIPLTPFQSFIKDLILLVFILIIFFNRNKIPSMIGKRESNIVILTSIVFPTLFTVYTYRHLPVMDFRVYKNGVNLMEAMTGTPGESKFVYVLKNKNSGENEEFDAFPDNWKDNYDYVGYEERVIVPGVEAEITDFSILDGDLVDFKSEYVNDSTTTFIVVSKSLSDLGTFHYEDGVMDGFSAYEQTKKHFEKINAFAEVIKSKSLKFIGLVAEGRAEIDEFRNELQTPFEVFTGDEKMIKTIIRSNPGLMLIKNGVITKKWHINDFPEVEEIEEMVK